MALAYGLVLALLGKLILTFAPRLIAELKGEILPPTAETEISIITIAILIVLIVVGGFFEVFAYSYGVHNLRTHKHNDTPEKRIKCNWRLLQTTWRALKIFVKTVFRLEFLGFTFVILLANAFVLLCTTLILNLPAIIIALANYEAHHGLLYGDPLGMPDYVEWLTAGVFIIAGFIQIYIRMSFLYPLYYLYGAIATRIEGKKRLIKDIAANPQQSSDI